MEIYVVQQGDTIKSIAEKYGVSTERLVQDNGLVYPYNLVIGQTIVIAYPKQTHIVQQGDTLQSIADSYNVSIMQILRNNPYVADRENLYLGELLVISYNTVGSITTNGYVYPFIRRETLIKTLPNLTYLTILNYTVTDKGELIKFYDDSEIIQTSKAYNVIPLLMLTTITLQGVPKAEIAYNILLNEEYQENHIKKFVDIMKNQGYLGINIVLNFLNVNSLTLYQKFIQKISEQLQKEGFLFFLTINYDIQNIDNQISIEQIDYSKLSPYVNGIIFLKIMWGTNYDPPAPVSNINNISALINYAVTKVSPDKVIVGQIKVGYNWKLPYQPNETYATSLTINSALGLAYETNAIIQFDEDSQTPYFYYKEFVFDFPTEHIVWFIDARSIDALDKLIIETGLNGSGIWNIMDYYQPLWTIINTTFDIIKLL